MQGADSTCKGSLRSGARQKQPQAATVALQAAKRALRAAKRALQAAKRETARRVNGQHPVPATVA
jgi:hypothetical protein